MTGQIFISYSRVDTEFVTRLITDLTRQGLNIWMDQRNIGAGQRWDSVIQDALEACDLFMIVLSPHSVESENVLDELSFAINSNKRIIPILLRNCEIPYRIARIQFVNFTRDYQTGFQHLISEITQKAPQRPITAKKQAGKSRSILWLVGIAVGLLCCFALGVGMYMLYPYYFPTDTPRFVTITPYHENIIPTTPPPLIITDTPTPAPPHAPEIKNTFGVQLYDEHQQLIVIQPGEQYTLKIMELWSAPEGAAPSCASGFMALTWIVRDPYPNGGEDLQLLHLIPMGDGRTEVIASGSQGSTSVGYCEEIYLLNNSLQEYRVEIRYASGIYP
ncbi:hypothetical protein ANAEL_00174 [Anaerolineales bacterium]|nr:hypothetical protein ANAEL_00174 [Anaerolineales bacterium]